MKRSIIILTILLVVANLSSSAQTDKDKKENKVKPPKEDGYEMKQYFFVMLLEGKNRTQDSATAAKIQEGHLANINRLAALGKIMVAGPFGDRGNWKGLFIFDASSKEEVEQMLKTDPAVSSGRLDYDIRPWWTAKNCVFK
jgi:uncharacterized protein YciI